MQGHAQVPTSAKKRAVGPICYMLTGSRFPGAIWGPFDSEGEAWRYYLGRDHRGPAELADLAAAGWRVSAGHGGTASHETFHPRQA